MNQLSSEVRSFIVTRLQTSLAAKGLQQDEVPDDFDLLTEGVIDSQGILELIVQLEEHFSIEIDLEGLNPENLTIVGPLCRYIAERHLNNGHGSKLSGLAM